MQTLAGGVVQLLIINYELLIGCAEGIVEVANFGELNYWSPGGALLCADNHTTYRTI